MVCWVWGTHTRTEEKGGEMGQGQTHTDQMPAQAFVEIRHPDVTVGPSLGRPTEVNIIQLPESSTPLPWCVTEWCVEANVRNLGPAKCSSL